MSEPLGFVSNITGGTPGLTSETALPPGAPLGLTPLEAAGPLARVLEEGRLTAGAMGLPTDEGISLAEPESTEPMLPADALNQHYGIPGHLTFSNSLPSSVAQMMNTAKRDELMREANAALQPGGVLPVAERFGIGVLNTFLDPLELAANAVPIVGEARLAGVFARAGWEGLPLTIASRAAAGGVSGAAAQLPLVGLRYGLSRAEQGDYGMMDAAADVLMGAAGGAILHPLFGLGRPLELPAGLRAATENPAVNEATARAAVAAVLDDRPVDVRDYIAWQNERAVQMGQMAALQRTANAMRAEAAGLADIVRDPATEARLGAIEEELTRPGVITPERRAELEAEQELLTAGSPLPDLERARNWAQYQGLQLAAERTERRLRELQESVRTSPTVREALGESLPEDAARVAQEAAQVRQPPAPKPDESSVMRAAPDPVQAAAVEQWAKTLRVVPVAEAAPKPAEAPVAPMQAVSAPSVQRGVAAPAAPQGQLRIDATWMKAASGTDDHGHIDAKAAASAVTNQVSAALVRGDKVTLNVEGKQVPIVAVRGSMMRDAEGKPWGSAPILFDPSGQRTFVEIQPAAAAAAVRQAETVVTPKVAAPEEKSGSRVPGRPVPKEPQRLLGFLRKLGGVRDDGGDVTAMLGGPRFRGGLVSTKGLPLDEAALRAWEAGYFPDFGEERPTTNDLLNAIEDDLRGTARYSHYDEVAVAAREEVIAHNAEIRRIADEHNINPAGMTRAEFANRIAEALSKDEMQREQESLDKATEEGFDEVTADARDYVEAKGDHWNPDEFYGIHGPRTLEELENEYRQANAARPVVQGAPSAGKPGAAGQSAGPGKEGGGLGGRAAAPAGRGEAERQPAAVDRRTGVRTEGNAGTAGRAEGSGTRETARPAGLKPEIAARLLPAERAEFEQVEQMYANAQGEAEAYAAAAACLAAGQV